MINVRTSLLIACVLIPGSLQAQTVIVDRPPGFAISHNNGALAGESNRFNNFSGFYPADHFVLNGDTTLESFTAFGSFGNPNSINTSSSSYEGFSIQIFNDDNGTPDGFAFADVFDGGNFGSEGVVYLPAVNLGSGLTYLQNGGGAVTVQIDFTAANGGNPIMLPAGEYWISIALRTPNWHPGDPSGRWAWQASSASGNPERVIMSRTTFDDVQIWEPVNLGLGNAFAWELTGQPETILGDTNMDGVVNLLDVAPFVDLLANGEFQLEADINQDGTLNLLDVGPFVEILSN